MQIIVKVDKNDADYMTEVSYIDKETLEKIKPLIAEIKNFEPYHTGNWKHKHNYPFEECLREDLGEKDPREIYPNIDREVFDIFEEYLPWGEFGFHTIESIEVQPDIETTKLL